MVMLGNDQADTDPDGLSAAQGDTTWNGNSQYFSALMYDMMEFDNQELSTTITRSPSQFYVVFDESRHVSSALTSPFTLSTIHFNTLIFSPKPGHMKLPSLSFLNQLTLNIFGAF